MELVLKGIGLSVCSGLFALRTKPSNPLSCIWIAAALALLGISGCGPGVVASSQADKSAGGISTLQISTPTLQNAVVGTAYATQFSASGGKAPYAWSIASGSLPTGVALNAATGAIAGMPTVTGSFKSLVQVTDSSSPALFAVQSLTLSVVNSSSPSAAPQITTSSLPNATAGTAYSEALTVSGGTAPYIWSATGLPAGISVISSSGVLSGTPTTAGDASVTIRLTDSSSTPQTTSVTLSLNVVAAASSTSNTADVVSAGPDIYGSGISAEALNNIPIGPNTVSYRFLATHSGTFEDARIYLITDGPHAGYNAGTGGTLLIQLETDDGTSNHNPSGKVLGSYTIVHPSNAFPVITFSPAPNLESGTFYHLVFSNTDPNPTANYVSVDDFWMPNPLTPMQPKYNDMDWAALVEQSATSWPTYPYNTPIFSVDFIDGTSMGMGYMEAWPEVPEPISGSDEVREAFTLSGSNTAVSSVTVFAKLVSGSSPLTVRLEESNGTLIEQGTISASKFSGSPNSGYGWGTYTFSSLHTLISGQAYNLVLEAPSGTTYQAYPIRKGSEYGFASGTWFPDGYAQFNAGGSWAGWTQWGISNRTDSDLQFYFSVVP
jgi:hypothetical protein